MATALKQRYCYDSDLRVRQGKVSVRTLGGQQEKYSDVTVVAVAVNESLP